MSNTFARIGPPFPAGFAPPAPRNPVYRCRIYSKSQEKSTDNCCDRLFKWSTVGIAVFLEPHFPSILAPNSDITHLLALTYPEQLGIPPVVVLTRYSFPLIL